MGVGGRYDEEGKEIDVASGMHLDAEKMRAARLHVH